MTNDDLHIILAEIENLAKSDPAMLTRLESLIRASAPTIYQSILHNHSQMSRERLVVPRFHDVTAAQITLFDNWKASNGRKPSRKRGEASARCVRFKAVLELWTVRADQKISTANRACPPLTVNLCDSVERESAMQRYEASKGGFALDGRSEEWSEFADLIRSFPAFMLGGPAFTKAQAGTTFALNTWMAVHPETASERGNDLQIVGEVGGETVRFYNFIESYAGRVPLAGNAVATSRLAIATHHPAWRTGLLNVEELKVAA